MFAVLLSLVATPAEAEWREASSKHFLVYSEGSEASLRDAVTKLEKYHFLLRLMSATRSPPSPIRIKIYLMRNIEAVQESMPYGGGGVAGFYTAGARGPIAVSTRRDSGGGNALEAQTILFHELAHHFMFQYFPATYPAWFSEGFADYYGTTQISDDDKIVVGYPLHHRYLSFGENRWLPLDKLLTAKGYADVSDKLDLLYAQGWLLVHYLSHTKTRSGQLQTYLNGINAGQSYELAMERAFGKDAKELNSELRSYAVKQRINTLVLPFKPIDVGAIQIRPLRPAENDLIKYDIALSTGVLASRAERFASDVRSDARGHAADGYALRILAETERLVGNHQAAEKAVDRWLAVAPDDGYALYLKAVLRIDGLTAAKSGEVRDWDAARELLVKASKLRRRDPQILTAYYDSFTAQGTVPPAGAQNSLFQALELLPQNDDIRHRLATDYEMRGMIAEAIAVFRPAAWGLHDPADETERQRKRRERAEERFCLAGETKLESAFDMLKRLERKRAETSVGGG